MIIVQLKGGLGNQLFAYAAGYSLAAHHNVEVKVDTTLLNRADEQIGTERSYELQCLVEPPQVATREELHALLDVGVIKRYAMKLLPPYKRTIYKEALLAYDQNFLKASPHIYLKGYRQSERYFQHVAQDIRKLFRFKDALVSTVEPLALKLASVESVALHIRRGDYSNKVVAEYHGILDQQYYQAAITAVEAKVHQPQYFVFSDEVSWVKSNLNFEGPVVFVSGELTHTHYQDFHLMSQCRHNIIANSTFSWWAAWLNENPNKIVIAPKKWYNKAELDTTDLIPEGWATV